MLLFLSVLCKDVHGDKRFDQAREFVEKLGIPEKVKSEIPERAKLIAKNIEIPKVLLTFVLEMKSFTSRNH